MPDGGYTGTVADFTKAHQDVVGVKESIEGQLKTVYNEVEGLKGLWQGQAATAFNQLMERFAGDAKNLNDALQGIADQLHGAGSQYNEQEQSKHSTFGNISARLG